MDSISWRKITQKYLQDYKPIGDHGLIGDQRTCALVAIDGSIDWLCIPRFDSPSVFASILDKNVGGSFRIIPKSEEFETRQFYEDRTNILITQFKDGNGILQILDFMPCFKVSQTIVSTGEIHRRISCIEGSFEFEISVEPKMNYGALTPSIIRVAETGYSFVSAAAKGQGLSLITPLEFMEEEKGKLSRRMKLSEEEKTDLVLRYGGANLHPGEDTLADDKLSETRAYWIKWASRCKYKGKWRDMVIRSSLALKLLVYSPSGAIVAAPTTSLPEQIHGVRNWDYRYSWIRDSSFVLWAFHAIGHDAIEATYFDWLMGTFYLTAQNMQVMAGVGGERILTETTLDNLEGYKGSNPVRIGNGAFDQFQLDLYGVLVDSLFFSHQHQKKLTLKVYEHLVRPVVKIVDSVWDKPDCGIWEVRGGKRNFVYSKMWCWVALDRAVKIASALNMKEDAKDWTVIRDEVRRKIYEKGWNEKVKSFVQSYNSTELDSANLLMPQVKFIDGRDPKMISTINAIKKSLMINDKFLYRYKTNDGLPGEEGAFLICSFWMVSCLTMAGKIGEAEKLLDSLLECSNHLGLFSEEINPNDGSMLGNFPQAFTHMGFITAATGIDVAKHTRTKNRRRS